MIVTSTYELEVRKIIIPERIFSEGKELKPQPLFIIKKATKEEFLEEFLLQYYSDNPIPKEIILPIEVDVSIKSYLEKKTGIATGAKNIFLKACQEYEKDKDGNSIKLQNIPAASLDILKNIDILKIIEKRRENLVFLFKNLSGKKYFLFNNKQIKSPFVLPLEFESEEKRNAVKKMLIKNNIYPPIHWDLGKIVPETYFSEHQLSKKILSIPIDQRYNVENLSRVVSILNSYSL